MTFITRATFGGDHGTYEVEGPNGRGFAEGPRDEFERIRAEAHRNAGLQNWPRFETAEVIEEGQAIAILVREADGTVSAVRIGIEQLAD